MYNIPMNTTGALTRTTVMSLNQTSIQGSMFSGSQGSIPTRPEASASPRPVPVLHHTIQKGQKVSLSGNQFLSTLEAKLGWNVTNDACDVDVSAFLLNSSGKVLGDDWFVFYGQDTSPDGSTFFSEDASADREKITIHFQKLHPEVSKIVFVLTIHEALEKHLNFSMLKDAYIRILDTATSSELVSFKMDEYYSNVTSMMIGEIYQYKGTWKFHAIGNGVARDLAGLCEFYGVQVI